MSTNIEEYFGESNRKIPESDQERDEWNAPLKDKKMESTVAIEREMTKKKRPFFYKKCPKEQKDEIVLIIKRRKKSLKEIAAIYDIPYRTIWRWELQIKKNERSVNSSFQTDANHLPIDQSQSLSPQKRKCSQIDTEKCRKLRWKPKPIESTSNIDDYDAITHDHETRKILKLEGNLEVEEENWDLIEAKPLVYVRIGNGKTHLTYDEWNCLNQLKNYFSVSFE